MDNVGSVDNADTYLTREVHGHLGDRDTPKAIPLLSSITSRRGHRELPEVAKLPINGQE